MKHTILLALAFLSVAPLFAQDAPPRRLIQAPDQDIAELAPGRYELIQIDDANDTKTTYPFSRTVVISEKENSYFIQFESSDSPSPQPLIVTEDAVIFQHMLFTNFQTEITTFTARRSSSPILQGISVRISAVSGKLTQGRFTLQKRTEG